MEKLREQIASYLNDWDNWDNETLPSEGADEILRMIATAWVWQPIETAPKDGREIILCGGLLDMGGYYRPSEGPRVVIAFWAEAGWEASVGGEFAYTSREDPIRVVEPTHWMLLPDPPEKTP